MQTYLLSGLTSPTSSVNLFLPSLKPRVSTHSSSSSSVHYHHYHNNKLTLHHRPTPGWGRNGGGIFASSASAAASAAAAAETETNYDHQDHYAVLGISASASSAEIKTAYRILVKKYHPDVCKDPKSAEVFKSIQHAYAVLSNKVTRAQYDFKRRQSKKYWQSYETYESSDESDTSEENERGSFNDVLISALFAGVFMQNNVSQLHILCFSLSTLYFFSRSWFAFSDRKLDGGSKLGYLIAWYLGGIKGILLTLCLSFESWAFGKRGGSFVTLVIVALWVVTNLVKVGIYLTRVGINIAIYPAKVMINLARYASSSIPQAALTRVGINLARYALTSIPRGALIALIYMSIKLQNDLKESLTS